MRKKVKMFKLNYKKFVFEITRRCNMNCAHCMRGPAQNHTISKKVIDKVLDQIGSIGSLYLTGGEPFLEPEMISYLFNGIIKRKIPIMDFFTVTNGSILNADIAKSFNELSRHIYDTYGQNWDKKQARIIGQITISNDQFHEFVDIPNALQFYRSKLNDHCIIKRERAKKDDTILVLGNAEKADLKGKKVRYTITPYRVELTDYFVDTTLLCGYDGRILIGEDASYGQMDQVNYGNIFDLPLSELLKNEAFNEPFTRDEARRRDEIYTIWKNKDFSIVTEDFCGIALFSFEVIYNHRERIHKIYPYLKFDKVVELAYHDANVCLKAAHGPNFDFMRLDNLRLFDTPVEKSEKILNKFKMEHLIDTLKGQLMFVNDHAVKPIPDKVTRERTWGHFN